MGTLSPSHSLLLSLLQKDLYNSVILIRVHRETLWPLFLLFVGARIWAYVAYYIENVATLHARYECPSKLRGGTKWHQSQVH